MAGHIIYVHATLPAPPAAVWDVITDVAHADRVFRSVHDSELVSDGPFGVGTVWREKRTLFGHRGEEELEVVECDPPMSLAVETRLRHDVVRTSYRLTGFGDRARLAMTTSVHMEGRSAIERLAWKFFGGFSYEHTHRMFEHDLEDIAEEVRRRVGIAA
jgi:hypothetical protein